MDSPVPLAVQGIADQYLVALITLLLGIILTRIGTKLLAMFLAQSGSHLLGKFGQRRARLAIVIIASTGYALAIVAALLHVELLKPVLIIFTIAATAIVIVLLLLTTLNSIPNRIAGRRLFRSRKLLLGKHLDLPGIQGKLVRFTATEIHVKNTRGEILRIPHRYLRKMLR